MKKTAPVKNLVPGKSKIIMHPFYDFFLCYGSENDHNIIWSLLSALKKSGLRCFMDIEHIDDADNFADVISYGLMNSRYVLAIITENFINIPWSMSDLQSVLYERTSTGQKKLIPVLAGTTGQQAYIMESIPELQSMNCIQWQDNPFGIVCQLRQIILNATPLPAFCNA